MHRSTHHVQLRCRGKIIYSGSSGLRKAVASIFGIGPITLYEFSPVLQSDLEEETQNGTSSSISHFGKGVGNSSGKAIRSTARKYGYGMYRLARSDGEFGFSRARAG